MLAKHVAIISRGIAIMLAKHVAIISRGMAIMLAKHVAIISRGIAIMLAKHHQTTLTSLWSSQISNSSRSCHSCCVFHKQTDLLTARM